MPKSMLQFILPKARQTSGTWRYDEEVQGMEPSSTIYVRKAAIPPGVDPKCRIRVTIEWLDD